MSYSVYILFSETLNRFYIGATSNFGVRMQYHFESATHKYTGKVRDWILFLKFDCDCKTQALLIERHIKRMKSKVYIQNLQKYSEIIVKLRKQYAC